MAAVLLATPVLAQQRPPAPQWPTTEGDFVVQNFQFADGETLPQLNLHYTTLGEPHRNAAGMVDNAVLIIHGTGGSGHQFLSPVFAGPLYGPGEPLDIASHYIILPDAIGHGKSSKPSNGLHAKFPHYGYHDMVHGEYDLLTQHLGVN
ncbi:MAG: alpha/beta fold hydrolase, partial [Terriglobales bacterium]